MRGRLALCGAAAIVLAALLIPAQSSAKGFLGAPLHHGGAFHFHVHGHGHGFLTRHAHGFRGRRHNPYADNYAFWPLGYDSGGSALEPVVVPLAYPIYAGPRCEHSVETVIVPAELGGERKIKITRC